MPDGDGGLESRMLELLTTSKQMEEERRVCRMTKSLAMKEHLIKRRLERCCQE
jgi:hypothetical protein